MGPLATRILPKLKAIGPDRGLAALMVLLVLLLMAQALRLTAAGVWAWWAGRPAEAAARPAPPRNDADPLESYYAMLDHGFIGGRDNKGDPPKACLFGILGSQALIGMSANDAAFFDLGAEVPGGEKLVSIAVTEVVLEKDGEKRTVLVFSGEDKPKPPDGPQEPPPPPAQDAPKPPPAEAPAMMPPGPPPQAPPPPPKVHYTAETIAGTKWSYQGMSASFAKDGKLTVDAGGEAVEGTWSIDGDTITINVMGEELTAKIDGDTISVDGNNVERVE